MGFAGNDSNKEVVKVTKLFTGVGEFKVIAVNPTKDELVKIYNTDNIQEPVYVTEAEAGHKKTRLDFYLQNDKVLTKVAFFLENTIRVNKDNTKTQFTNRFGQFSWGTTKQECIERISQKTGKSFFSIEGATEAYIGQEDLIEFLRKWLNVESGGMCQVENISKIAQGDVSELKKYVSQFSTNIVKCLIGVAITDEDKQYQRIYTKYFERKFIKNFTGFNKSLNSEYGEFKADYQNSFTFQEFTGESLIEKPDKENTNSEGVNPFA